MEIESFPMSFGMVVWPLLVNVDVDIQPPYNKMYSLFYGKS